MSKLINGLFTSLGILAIVAMGALGIATITFIPKFASIVYPYLMALTGLGVGLVIIMLPFTYFTKLRTGIATTTLVVSYVIGAGFWAYSAIVAYKIWGMTGLITGLVFAGVGVVPVAFLACVFNAEWMVILNIVFAAFLTFGTRGLSMYIMSKALNTNTPPPSTNVNLPPKPHSIIIDENLNGDILNANEFNPKPVAASSVIILPYNPITPVERVRPEQAINVNAGPKPQGDILDEILKGTQPVKQANPVNKPIEPAVPVSSEAKPVEQPVKPRMNPLPGLCQNFLDQHQGVYRNCLLDQIANSIMGWGELGMDSPYPTTAKALRNRIDDLLINAGKLEKAQEMLMPIDADYLGVESLEELACCLED